jgi:hypothetical protein
MFAAISRIQLCFASNCSTAAVSPQGLTPAGSAPAYHVVDSRLAAAALGEELRALTLSTQPKGAVPPTFKEATALLGAALVAIAELLA